jgi:membrane-associated protease RseP (regulator of RpoE activity)
MKQKRAQKLIVIFTLAGFSLVMAQQDSPAFALFTQIVDRLETEYVNPNNLELGSVTKKYKAQLEGQCANAGKTCTYSIAEPVIRAMLAEFRDPHLFMTSTLETATAESAAGQLGRDTHQSRYGLRLISVKENLIVGFVQPDTSAAKAGVFVGDHITMIDGNAVRDPVQAMNQISADEANGKRRILTLERGQAAKKAEISPLLSTFWKPTLNLLDQQTAVITIPSFQGFRPADGSTTTDQVVHDLILEASKRTSNVWYSTCVLTMVETISPPSAWREHFSARLAGSSRTRLEITSSPLLTTMERWIHANPRTRTITVKANSSDQPVGLDRLWCLSRVRPSVLEKALLNCCNQHVAPK